MKSQASNPVSSVKQRMAETNKALEAQRSLWDKLNQSLKLQELWPGIFGDEDNPNVVRARWVSKPLKYSHSVRLFVLRVSVIGDQKDQWLDPLQEVREFSEEQVAPEFKPPKKEERA